MMTRKVRPSPTIRPQPTARPGSSTASTHSPARLPARASAAASGPGSGRPPAVRSRRSSATSGIRWTTTNPPTDSDSDREVGWPPVVVPGIGSMSAGWMDVGPGRTPTTSVSNAVCLWPSRSGGRGMRPARLIRSGGPAARSVSSSSASSRRSSWTGAPSSLVGLARSCPSSSNVPPGMIAFTASHRTARRSLGGR